LIKEFIVKNIGFYWNSMSEMYIPSSLWEETRHLPFQIFEAMPASQLREIMIGIFTPEGRKNTNYLISPSTVKLCISYYNKKQEEIKAKDHLFRIRVRFFSLMFSWMLF
jgi:hypothetical protein